MSKIVEIETIILNKTHLAYIKIQTKPNLYRNEIRNNVPDDIKQDKLSRY